MGIMTPKINIFSSNVNDLNLSKSIFENEGFNVNIFKEVNEQSINTIYKNNPDIVLLDIDVKNSDGIELCHQLKNESNISSYVVLYTKHQEEYIQVEAFKAGADDYIIKPINNRLFLKRIEALLKRKPNEKKKHLGNKLIYKDLEIDRESYTIVKSDNEIVLPRKEFEMLCLLVKNPKKVFSREELFEKIWNRPSASNNRIIDVHIRKIREHVGDKIIKTIKGVGYQLS